MLFYPTVHVIPKTVYHIWNIEGNKRRKGISPYVNNIFLNRHENVSATRALPPLKKFLEPEPETVKYLKLNETSSFVWETTVSLLR